MRRADLVADCQRCAAVCCIATSFEASSDFAFDKAAGVRCRHLGPDRRCTIHDELAARGCAGCAVYECYGAGPRVTQIFAGRPAADAERDAVFLALRGVHELLWMLTEAAKLCPPGSGELLAALDREIAALDAIASAAPAIIVDVDLRPHQRASGALLRRVGVALGRRDRTTHALVVLDAP